MNGNLSFSSAISKLCAALVIFVVAEPVQAPALTPPPPHQIRCLAQNIYHEARGEGVQGALMVARVTLTRTQLPEYPDTLCGVVFQPHQFSWTKHKTPKFDLWSLQIAERAVRENTLGSGATHYHNKKSRPLWRLKLKPTQVVGNHIFYKAA